MKAIAIALTAILTIPTVSEAGDFRCRKSIGNSVTCRDTSLFGDTNPAQDMMMQQMQFQQQMQMDASRRAAEQHNQLMMQIIQMKLQNRN